MPPEAGKELGIILSGDGQNVFSSKVSIYGNQV
jgi:hypothetical protein